MVRRPRKKSRVEEQGQTGSEHGLAESTWVALDLDDRSLERTGYSVPVAGECSSGKGQGLILGAVMLLLATRAPLSSFSESVTSSV